LTARISMRTTDTTDDGGGGIKILNKYVEDVEGNM
jgi:hypothetical protein